MDRLRRTLSSQLGQNVITNYLAVVWMGGLSLGLLPVYVARLGAEQWGVVALCITIQGFFGLLDSGLGQIMPRDVARAAGDVQAEAKVFGVFSRVYLGLGVLGFVLGQLAVPWLVEHWFNLTRELAESAAWSLRLVLVQFLFQFANNACIGFWNGTQAQSTANLRQCAFASAKHASAVLAVYVWRAEAPAYMLGFAAFSALEWWLNQRFVASQFRGRTPHIRVSSADLRGLLREAGLFASGVLVGMLVTQLDRIVLSRSVDVASFGRYVIVANLGLAFTQLQYPLVRAYFPRLVQADGSSSRNAAKQLLAALIALCVLPCALVAALAPQILTLWIGDPATVSEGTTPLRLILAAVAANAIFQLIYQQILLRGLGRLLLLINVSALLVVGPVLWMMAPAFGIVAGGVAWIMLSAVQCGVGGLWLRKVLSTNPARPPASST